MDTPADVTSIERFYPSLYRFALSLSRNESVAADLTQETCYLWASKGHQLRDLSRVKSWLFTTLHREFLRRERQGSRISYHENQQIEAELAPMEPSMFNHVDAQTVMSALQRVDEHYRVPLAMFYLEDFSYREIAEALDVPTGTVMSRPSRGKDQLRQLLVESPAHCKIVPLPQSARRAQG